MPKKKEKKQDDVKKTQKKEKSSSPAAGSGSEDREKELYLLQARHLSEQLERYQLESDHQERRQKELISRYAALEKEKSDIVDFLKRSVLEKEVEAEELTEQLESQQRVAGEQEAALRLQLEELREELRGRVVEQLTVKCRQLQAELEDGRQQGARLQSDHAGVLLELEALRRDRASLSERSADGTAEVSRLEAELRDERRRSNRMRSIMREAAEALRGALREVRTDREEDEGEEEGEGWKRLMEKLLLLLDRPKHDRLEESLTSDLSASGALVLDPVALDPVALDPALSLRFQLARYRPGDLGLVPQPKQKAVTHRTLNRKPSNQNAAGSLTRAGSRKSFTGPK
ncbi:hypothetical protein EYF80_041104 [Liparis tanakae]|uniref:Cilia- and flagella-associated protein 157 n=1 Tax=Liparis tanakae TaxID=230148 RepID=A0A4Z2G538_9TELE|nr:hypothetical protein EYF80_041104 [Liparis tanakae]